MPFTDLRSYITELERKGELRRITAPVSPELEITEIAIRSLKEEGPALLFENVEGSDYPVAINLLASRRRIEIALGIDPAELGDRLLHFLQRVNPPSLGRLWENRSMALRMLNFRPGGSRGAPAQEVVEHDPDLGALPILKCWPGDGGRFITLPMVFSRDPETGVRNVGVYRMHVYDAATTGMHMQIQKGGGFHHHNAEKRGEPLPMAVALGGDPALWIAAVTALPEGIDEIAFSGLLRGKRTPMAPARTLNMRVPARAEFILEGEVPPNERRREGPFGDHFGHYSEASDFPIFNIKAITRRRSPIYPATVVGKPPQEDRFIGEATQEIMTPLARLVHPELTDMWAYFEAGFHNLLVAAVETRYEKEPMKTAFGLLGQGQLALTKVLVLVDPDVNVRSFSEVLKAIRRNYTPEEDFQLLARAPLDTLDFTGERMHRGSKMIIDATGRGSERQTAVPVPGDLRSIAPSAINWRMLDNTMLVVQTETAARDTVRALVASEYLERVKIAVAVSPDIDLDDETELLWGIFTRFDPALDLIFTRSELHGSLPAYHGVMGIDATLKDRYPRALEMDPDIVRKVDQRWGEYFGN